MCGAQWIYAKYSFALITLLKHPKVALTTTAGSDQHQHQIVVAMAPTKINK